MKLKTEFVFVFGNMLVCRGGVVLALILLFNVSSSAEYSNINLSWGGTQLMVAFISQAIVIGVFTKGFNRLSGPSITFILISVLVFLIVYYHLNVITTESLTVIFWALTPFYILKQLVYSQIVVNYPSLYRYIFMGNILYFSFGAATYLIKFDTTPVSYLTIFIALSPITDFISITVWKVLNSTHERPSANKVLKETLERRSNKVMQLSELLNYSSISNGSQASFQIFLLAMSRVSAEASAITALAYQFRALPLAIVSSMNQLVLRRGDVSVDKSLRIGLLYSLTMVILMMLAGAMLDYLGIFSVTEYLLEFHLLLLHGGMVIFYSLALSHITRSNVGRASLLSITIFLTSIVIYLLQLNLLISVMLTIIITLIVSFLSWMELRRSSSLVV